MPTQDFPFYSAPEAADAIGVTEGRIRQMLLNGDLKGTKLGERNWAIPSEEVERLKKTPQTKGRPRVGKG